MKEIKKFKLSTTIRAFDPTLLSLRLIRIATMLCSITALIATTWAKEYALLLCILAALFAGWEILWGTVQELMLTKLHRGQLVILLSAFIVFCTGHMVEATIALLIAAFGFWLREIGRRAAGEDMLFFESLLSLKARFRDGNKFVIRDAATLAPGTVIEVFSGEIVPADGVVISGGGTLDYSGWLHHRKVVSLQEGVVVYCGAVNYGQPITVRVTAAGKYTLAQKMKGAAAAALENKSTVQTVLRKLSLPFGALMLLIALIVGVFVPLFGGAPWGEALYRGANVIALAGMGEIVVTVSLAFAAGINALSRRGVLFKSCRQVMLLRRITDLIFSKTGTLTERNFLVYEVVPHNDFSKEELLYYAAAAEQVSDHLIAAAIVKKAGDIKLPTPEHSLCIDGEGVCAVIDGKRVFVGNDLLMNRAGIRALPYHGNGIVCLVGVEDTYVGCIILNDPVKPGAASAIDGLFRMGIRSIDLVTGDKKKNGENVALSLGLHRVFAELSSKEKTEVVARNARKGKYGGRIAFVGDESDIGCIQAADISFALKTVEDDLQGTAADIAVLSDHPDGVLHSFVLCEKIRKTVTTMLILSGITKLSMLILILVYPMPYWYVVLSEVFLSIVGTLLASRCRNYK